MTVAAGALISSDGQRSAARLTSRAGAPPPVRAEAFAASLPSGRVAPPAEPPRPGTEVQKLREYVEEPMAGSGSSNTAVRGYEGRPAVGKKKPLKINLDLALVRCRVEGDKSMD